MATPFDRAERAARVARLLGTVQAINPMDTWGHNSHRPADDDSDDSDTDSSSSGDSADVITTMMKCMSMLSNFAKPGEDGQHTELSRLAQSQLDQLRPETRSLFSSASPRPKSKIIHYSDDQLTPVCRDTSRVHRPTNVPLTLLARAIYVASQSRSRTNTQPPPIVSVGSGNQLVENHAGWTYPGLNIITVDNFSSNFCKGLRVADYPTVEKLLEARPELVGNCVLLLIWPEPNKSTYDYEAVQLLNPLNVLILYERTLGPGPDDMPLLNGEPHEMTGASAGDLMHEWMGKCRTTVSEYKLLSSYRSVSLAENMDGAMTCERNLIASPLHAFEMTSFKYANNFLQWYVRRGTNVPADRAWEPTSPTK